jgi:CRP-like cAMP-binding protein
MAVREAPPDGRRRRWWPFRRAAPAATFLGRLTDGDVAAARALLEACPVVRLSKGEHRVAHSLPPAALFVVEGGPIAVRLPGQGPRAVVTLIAPSGAVVPSLRPGASLQGLRDARITVVSASILERMLAIPCSARGLLEGLETSTRHLEESTSIFAHHRHVDRVRQRLLQLARDFGRVDSRRGGVRIDLPLTHDLLAEMTGSARETASRSVEELERDGFVTRRGRFYVVQVAPGDLDTM